MGVENYRYRALQRRHGGKQVKRAGDWRDDFPGHEDTALHLQGLGHSPFGQAVGIGGETVPESGELGHASAGFRVRQIIKRHA